MKRVVALLLGSALWLPLAGQGPEYRPQVETIPGPPVKQPIAYSHKVHIANGLVCENCHTMPGEGFLATYPDEALCMTCHQVIKTDSPEIQKLAGFVERGERVPWVRIYRLPDFVWFNHALHVEDAELECSQCHGEVAQRDVLFKEKSISMATCMDCHAQKQAPNGCDVCHATQ